MNLTHSTTRLVKLAAFIYQKFLARAWSDGSVQSGERETLAWAAKCLELPAATLRALNLKTARPRFAEALAVAMDDGEIGVKFFISKLLPLRGRFAR